MLPGDDDDDVVLEDFDEDDDAVSVAPLRRSNLLENLFGVGEDSGRIVMTRRPGGRLDLQDALNLAAWIVAASGAELSDFEELVQSALEGAD